MPAISPGSRLVRDLADHAFHGRHPGHLVDDVPIGPGHGERVAVAPTALGDDGGEVHPGADQHPDGAGGHHPVAVQQPYRPGPFPRKRCPPTTGRPGRTSSNQWRNSSAGKVKGSASSISAAGSNPRSLRPPGEVPRVVGQPGGGEGHLGQRPHPSGPQAEGGRLLDLPPGADGRLHRAPHHDQRAEDGRHRSGDVLQGPGMGPGGCDHHQVGVVADGLRAPRR